MQRAALVVGFISIAVRPADRTRTSPDLSAASSRGPSPMVCRREHGAPGRRPTSPSSGDGQDGDASSSMQARGACPRSVSTEKQELVFPPMRNYPAPSALHPPGASGVRDRCNLYVDPQKRQPAGLWESARRDLHGTLAGHGIGLLTCRATNIPRAAQLVGGGRRPA